MDTPIAVRPRRTQHLQAFTALALASALVGILSSCKKSQAPQPAARQGAAPAEERVEKNPDRNAYFGEEYIHTSWSVDAWLMGNRLTGPDEALKYAQGQTIKHPMGYDITYSALAMLYLSGGVGRSYRDSVMARRCDTCRTHSPSHPYAFGASEASTIKGESKIDQFLNSCKVATFIY